MKTLKIIIFLFIIFNLIFPLSALGQLQVVNQPENLEEAEQMAGRAAEFTRKEGPGIIANIWKNEVIPIWKKMFYWVKESFWDNWLEIWFKNIWTTTVNIFRGEVAQRKPAIEEEFQKEKQELKGEAPVVGKTLWQKFLELIK